MKKGPQLRPRNGGPSSQKLAMLSFVSLTSSLHLAAAKHERVPFASESPLRITILPAVSDKKVDDVTTNASAADVSFDLLHNHLHIVRRHRAHSPAGATSSGRSTDVTPRLRANSREVQAKVVAFHAHGEECHWVPADDCVPKFDWGGSRVVGCSEANHHTPWCSHSEVYEMGNYSECKYQCFKEQGEDPSTGAKSKKVGDAVAGNKSESLPSGETEVLPVAADADTPLMSASLSEYCTPEEELQKDDLLFVNTRVIANWKGYGTWFRAKVLAINHDVTYKLEYRDGVVEYQVPPERIQKTKGRLHLNNPSKTDPACKVSNMITDLQHEVDKAHGDVISYLNNPDDFGKGIPNTNPSGDKVYGNEWKRVALLFLDKHEDGASAFAAVDRNVDGKVSEAEVMLELQHCGVPPDRAEKLTENVMTHIYGDEAGFQETMSGMQFKEMLQQAAGSQPDKQDAAEASSPAASPSPAVVLAAAASPTSASDDEVEKIRTMRQQLKSWEDHLMRSHEASVELRKQVAQLRHRWSRQDELERIRPIPDEPAEREAEVRRLRGILGRRVKTLDTLLTYGKLEEDLILEPEEPEIILHDMEVHVVNIGELLDKLKAKAKDLQKKGLMDVELKHEVDRILGTAGTMKGKMHEIIGAEKQLGDMEATAEKANWRVSQREVVRGDKLNDGYNKELRELDIVMREMRTDTLRFDTKVVPNKEKWWRYRWEYSFVEAILLAFCCLIAMLWEAVHWVARDWVRGKARESPTSMGGDSADLRHPYFDKPLVVSWSRWLFGEMWVMVMIITSIWCLDRVGFWTWWVRASWEVTSTTHLPTEEATYAAMAVDVAVQLAVATMFFFGLMYSVVRIAMRTEGHFKRLEHDEEDRDATPVVEREALAASTFAQTLEEYENLRLYFIRSVSKVDQVDKALYDITHGSKRFLLWYFVSEKVKRGVEDSFMIRVMTWVYFFIAAVVFAALHWSLALSFASLTTMLVLLALLPTVAWVSSANAESSLTKRELDTFCGKESEQEITTPEAPHNAQGRARWHREANVRVFAPIFQASVLLLCYSASRVVFSPWVRFFYWWQAAFIVVAVLCFALFFRFVASVAIVRYFIAKAFPPHIEPRDAALMRETGEEAVRLEAQYEARYASPQRLLAHNVPFQMGGAGAPSSAGGMPGSGLLTRSRP